MVHRLSSCFKCPPAAPMPIYGTHDRDTFGRAQAQLFDAYFRFSLLCLAAAGFSGAGLAPQNPSVSFLVALASVVANLIFFGPQTTITLKERQRVCKDLGVDRKDPHPEVPSWITTHI